MVTAVVSQKERLYVGLDGGGLNIYDVKNDKLLKYTTHNSGISGDNLLSLHSALPGMYQSKDSVSDLQTMNKWHHYSYHFPPKKYMARDSAAIHYPVTLLRIMSCHRLKIKRVQSQATFNSIRSDFPGTLV